LNNAQLVHYYFVDEAGDLTLFDKRGKIIVGNEGVSRLFMVGVAHLSDPAGINNKFASLRNELLNDPYFKNVPSMRPQTNRTAIYFHAKDDLPEVRREVFKLLPQLGIKVQVIIRRKLALAHEAQHLYKFGHKLKADNIYDDLVKRLFKNMLHKADENHIVFAKRGKADRQEALENAIEKARANFQKQWGITADNKTTIVSGSPSEHGGLQVIDYYLWALQRMFERGEDRFFGLVAKDFRLVMDIRRHKK
jgi:hypothetical protein